MCKWVMATSSSSGWAILKGDPDIIIAIGAAGGRIQFVTEGGAHSGGCVPEVGQERVIELDLQNAWSVASKDFKTFRKRKGVIYATIAFPLGIALGFPGIVFAIQTAAGPSVTSTYLTPFSTRSPSVMIGAATLPSGIASSSIVGEKVQKRPGASPCDSHVRQRDTAREMYRLLRAPESPAIYASAIVYMILMDAITYPGLGYLYYPNWGFGVILLALAPLGSILSIELTVILSAQANDIRSVQQFTGVIFFPFIVIYVLTEIGVIPLNATSLLIISGIFLLVDLLLFYLSTATFKRENVHEVEMIRPGAVWSPTPPFGLSRSKIIVRISL